MVKMAEDEARKTLKEAKAALKNNAISFDLYVEVKKKCKKAFEKD